MSYETAGMNPIREQGQSVNQHQENGSQTNSAEALAFPEQTENLAQSQHIIAEDEIERRNKLDHMDAETNHEKDNCKASKDAEVKNESASFNGIRSFLTNSGKSHTGIKGSLYHLHVAQTCCLRLFKQQDDFIISVEVADAGKFDDIVCHSQSGTWCMQLKHKETKWNITENGLFAPSGDHSIATYLESYLDVNNSLKQKGLCPFYALCTNATDEEIKDLLRHYEPPDIAMRLFFQDIKATCHRFNPDKLIETIKESCLNRLGTLFAKTISSRGSTKTNIISFDSGLLTVFASLIKQILLPLDDKSSDPSVLMCTVKEKCVNVDGSESEIGIFLDAFRKGNGTKQLKIKIDKKSFNAVESTGWYKLFEQQLRGFCERFVLVLNSSGEEKIREEAKTKLPKWCKVEQDTILAKLKEKLFEALKSPVPIGRKDLQLMFLELESKEIIATLKSESKEYLNTLNRKYPYIVLESERLQISPLNAFVTNDESVHEFSCSLDLDVRTLIIDQTLSLHDYETLVLHSDKYQEKRGVLDILEDLFCYLRDLDHQTIKVIVILGQLQDGDLCKIKEMCAAYRQKAVIVGTTTAVSVITEKFFVRDLKKEATQKFFRKYENQKVFGTVTPISRIIHQDDDLDWLVNVLELYQQPEQLEKYDPIRKRFQNIAPWYIHRVFLPLDHWSQSDNSNIFNRVSSIKGILKWCRPFSFKNIYCCISNIHYRLLGFKKTTFVKLKNSLKPRNQEREHPPGFGMDEDDKKVYILLDEAGAGKSSYFTWLAWRLSTNHQSLYVIKLIAFEYSTDFERLEESGIEDWSDDQIVRFLYRLIHLALFVPSISRRTIEETDEHRAESDRCAEALSMSNGLIVLDNTKINVMTSKQLLELRLFREKFNHKQLILIFDGFDEIAPYYKDVVMKLFIRFSHFEGIRKVYLSSRPYDLMEELEKSFPNCQMYRLKKFSTRDVGTFLHNRLALNIDHFNDDSNKDQQSNFLVILYCNLLEILGNSATVPLFLDMAFESLLPAIKEHVNFKKDKMSVRWLKSSKLDILQLVEQFVTRKMQILHTDKSGSTNAAASNPVAKQREKKENKRITEKHMLLAMCALFDSDDRAKLLSKQDSARVAELLEEVKEAEEKTGIICGVQNGRPQFVHRLFAEYFVACWLYQNQARFKQEPVFQSKAIWSKSMEKVRELFNRMVVRESATCKLHLAVLDRNEELFEEIIRYKPYAVTVCDSFGRPPLRVDVCFGIGRFALDKYLKQPLEIINYRDFLYGWNALDYAFVLRNNRAVETLIKRKAALNVEILIQQLSSNDTDYLIEQSCKYIEMLYDCEQLEIANEISARVVRQLINERKVDMFAPRNKLNGQSVLEYCANSEDGCMFLQFVRQIGIPLVQVLQDGLGDRLFQIAFKKRAIHVIKHLIEDCNILLPSIIDTNELCTVVSKTIEKKEISLFEHLFQQLCRQMNVICSNVTENEVHEPSGEDFGIDYHGECCFRYTLNDKFPFTENGLYGKIFDEKYIMEYLLAQAVHTGHVKIASYIHQKTKMTVTNKLILRIMTFLSEQQNLLIKFDHKKSIPAFQYLLNKTTDLRSVDTDGRSLFHIIAQNGCAYMLPCLIAKGFDPTEKNLQNNWNGLNYYTSFYKISGEERFPKIFYWLLPYFDDHLKNFITFESIYECQIGEYDYELQQVLYFWVERMLSKQDTNSVLNAIWAARETRRLNGKCPATEWFKIYNNFIKSIPIL